MFTTDMLCKATNDYYCRLKVLIVIMIKIKCQMVHATCEELLIDMQECTMCSEVQVRNVIVVIMKHIHEARVVLLVRARYSSSSSSLYSSVGIDGPYSMARCCCSALRKLRIREDNDLRKSVYTGRNQHTW